jgi:hypothetical protein
MMIKSEHRLKRSTRSEEIMIYRASLSDLELRNDAESVSGGKMVIKGYKFKET